VNVLQSKCPYQIFIPHCVGSVLKPYVREIVFA
jgi:hypothetical protein